MKKTLGKTNLRNIGKDKSVMVLPADKGKATVVMDKEDYEKKVKDMLSDERTYLKLDNDPTLKYRKKLVSETNEWFTRWKINFRFIHILLQSYYYNRSMYNRTVIYYILSFLTFLKVYTG